MRSIFFAKNRDSAGPFYNLLSVLNFNNIYKLKVALFGYKVAFNKQGIPNIFIGYATPATEVHNYNTRYASQLNFYKPSVRTNYGISTFKFSLTTIWKSIPYSIKNLPTYHQFKRKYQFHLLNLQLQNYD